MGKCVLWPLKQQLTQVHRTGILATGNNTIYFGPAGEANTTLAWVILLLNMALDQTMAGGQLTPYFQFNFSDKERIGDNALPLGRWVTDNHVVYPIIGGMGGSLEAAGGALGPASRQRPLYVPWPSELRLDMNGATAGRRYYVRALVLETSLDTDVSQFL